jgi:(1->4)-alpha-D-glucan 1-alpha-D-glucosylmutase
MLGAMPDAIGRYGTPRATYRIQLTPDFGLAQAAGVVPYLARLGISHLYLSPFWEAVGGSRHGYDVTDHNQVRRQLGGLGDLYVLSEALVASGMGLIADFVPNHVGIGSQNQWWQDVLRYGRESPFAEYFDIDWEAQPQMEGGVVWYPVLGKPFGRALEDGEICLTLEDGEPWVSYYGSRMPVSPGSYQRLFGMPPAELSEETSTPGSVSRLASVLDDLGHASRDEAEGLRGDLRRTLESEPALRGWAQQAVTRLNGNVGTPETFDALERLLLAQHYRLADWRVSSEEINYRRFFDNNGLAAIRVEREDVFDEIHRLLLELVAAGIVTGVRIDHVDGLYLPALYLERLRARLDEAAAGRGHVPIYVEKVLEPGEQLPNWPVEGTTGYDFLAHADGLLIDRAGERALAGGYRAFTGERKRFREVAYESKLHIAHTAFAGEVNVLALHLYRIAQRHRLYRDNTLRSLRRAIAATLAAFPVYRTYASAPETAPVLIRQAVEEARRRDHTLSSAALDFLREVLALDGDLDEEDRSRREHFRRRFEQLSGPIMAKGVEDTALFRSVAFLALNEVGASPQHVVAPGEAHEWFGERAERWPNAMSASSTHDTKRSEDVRSRIAVLSQVPTDWRREVSAWHRLNERHLTLVNGDAAPDAGTEWYYYQTLIGAWPPGGLDESFVDRLREHMRKAAREAKLATSWTDPDLEYETALDSFVRATLTGRAGAAFRRRVSRFVALIEPAAEANSLAAVTLKCLAPGVPDFYQGTELRSLALTDPDNRRPVDFCRAERLLAQLAEHPPKDADGRKLWLTAKLLDIRAAWPSAVSGDYEAVEVRGPAANNLFAFMRSGGGQTVIVVVARLGLLLPETGWAGTELLLPTGDWTDLLSAGAGPAGNCERLFEHLPVAVLGSQG